eukprot:TRINITY_DN2892_c0_g1_i2.p1 TRINITY_DN2892_c0_g1~~TRINITY_DN2892_c0_g1_i2.p1  ORF type:complete len:247 (-),score=78.55 TRINITY_DN2892_c0_g1_i2:18-758(-)
MHGCIEKKESHECVSLTRIEFKNPTEDSDMWIPVTVLQDEDEDYGSFLWPGAIALSLHILSRFSSQNHHFDMKEDKGEKEEKEEEEESLTACEIGAGCGLPSLCLSKIVAPSLLVHVDSSSHPEHGERFLQSCMRNFGTAERFRVCCMDWRHMDEITDTLLWKQPFDVIIASDVLYDASDFDHVFCLIAFLLRKKGSICLMSFQERSVDRFFGHLMEKWSISASIVESYFVKGRVVHIIEMHSTWK